MTVLPKRGFITDRDRSIDIVHFLIEITFYLEYCNIEKGELDQAG